MATAAPQYLPAPSDQSAVVIHDDGRTEHALVIAYRIDGADLVPVTYPAAGVGDRIAVHTGGTTLHLHGDRREYNTLSQILEALGQ